MCFSGIRKECAHLSIIDELSIIPVAGRDISPLDGDCSRPSSTTACARKGSAMRSASGAAVGRLTTAIGHDIERGSRNAFHTAVFCCVRLVSKVSF